MPIYEYRCQMCGDTFESKIFPARPVAVPRSNVPSRCLPGRVPPVGVGGWPHPTAAPSAEASAVRPAVGRRVNKEPAGLHDLQVLFC